MATKKSSRKKSAPWYRIWRDAVLSPSLDTYEGFLQDPGATLQRGLFWISLAGLIGGFVGLLAQPRQAGFGPELMLFCGAPVLALLSLVSGLLFGGIIHLISRMLGGQGDFSSLIYALSAFDAPLTIASGLVYLLPYGIWIVVALEVYWFALSILAVKAVYGLPWNKSVVPLIPIALLILLLVLATPMLMALANQTQ